MRTTRLLAAALCFCTITTTASAQSQASSDAASPGHPPNAFGTATSIQTIQVVAMTPQAGASYLQNTNLHRYMVGGSGFFYGSLDVPSGSLVTAVELEACDGNAAIAVTVQLLRCAAPGSAACTVMADVGTPLIGTPGCSVFIDTSIFTPLIDNQNFRYPVVVNITGANSTVSAGGVRVAWLRQVSPAPGTATFSDIPVGHPFHRFVEALVASGITGGCGGGNYCPDAALTRGQMAVFIATALGLHWPN